MAVNKNIRPEHYGGDKNPHEAIKIIEHYDLNFSRGCAIKYILRADKKGTELEDLEKAKQYLEFEINKLKKRKQ
jgi:hypothetical protein